MAVNAHRAFNGSHEEAFLNQIKLPDEDKNGLRAARDEIRSALKQGLRDWPTLIEESVFLKDGLRASTVAVQTPKFRMQGSFSYHTVNDPAQKPPQEVDLDDGMFLPVSFLEENGGRNPAIVSSAYFTAVETILTSLCQAKGWTLTEKASCVRVLISRKAHVDVALYAIPDSEFETLVELSARTKDSVTAHDLRESLEFAASTYRGLNADQIMLAHRDKGWIASDPRKLEDWFTEAVRTYGDQVRFVSRYLKAWRDEEWPDARLASIALMSATVTVFEDPLADRTLLEGRDDLALLSVAERLPDILRSPIPNPVVEGERLDQGWSDGERQTFVEGAERLSNSLRDAISASSSAALTVELLRESLGERLPDDAELIEVITGLETKSAVGAPAVLATGLFSSDVSAEEREAVKLDGDERYA